MFRASSFTPRRIPQTPISSANISARSTPSLPFDSRLRDFDRETEAKFRQIRKQDSEQLSKFDREWILNHSSDLDRADRYLCVRDLGAREELLTERQRLEHDRKKQRVALVRKQKEAHEQFYEMRRRERSGLHSDSQQFTMALSLPTSEVDNNRGATAIRVIKKVRDSSAFLAGRTRFLESKQLMLGKFRTAERPAVEECEVALLDADNLNRVLEATDRIIYRRKTDAEFRRSFSDRGHVPAPPDGEAIPPAYGFTGIPMSHSGSDRGTGSNSADDPMSM
jgi:hypothetical protein